MADIGLAALYYGKMSSSSSSSSPKVSLLNYANSIWEYIANSFLIPFPATDFNSMNIMATELCAVTTVNNKERTAVAAGTRFISNILTKKLN